MIGRDPLPLPTPTQRVAADPSSAWHVARFRPRLRVALAHAKATFDEGESLWTPVLVYLWGWLLVLPAFLLMTGLSFGAYYLVGGI